MKEETYEELCEFHRMHSPHSFVSGKPLNQKFVLLAFNEEDLLEYKDHPIIRVFHEYYKSMREKDDR